MIAVFLLCVVAGMPAAGQILDVCATCHINATCADKVDGSGKVCHCNFGFVGNGRTFCQDKDECQIGATRMCGQHTKCHNTYGSYHCTCLSGYNPSNKMAVFIPNDGTYCQDIDECSITGVCGEGGQCRNLDGSFECSCHVGYQVDNGTEPFHPYRDKASCKVVDCGQPVSVEDAVLESVTGTTYGSVATWVCDIGFIFWSGLNTGVCGANGLWRGPTMVCEEVDCGSPPARPHSHVLWNQSSRMGSEVVYQCNSGYHNVGEGNVSICTAAGQWEEPPVLCQETVCGSPPVSESTEYMWNGGTAPGSTVLYFCKTGFLNKGGRNVSVCNESGQWTPPTLLCQEILCGDPPTLSHTGQVRNGSSTPGSTVTYYCKIGFYHSEGSNVSLCTINGSWTKPNISCKDIDECSLLELCGEGGQCRNLDGSYECSCHVGYQVDNGKERFHSYGGEAFCKVVDCGQPVSVEDAVLLSFTGTTYGSEVSWVCDEGFVWGSGLNTSVCEANGLWRGPTMVCEEVDCGSPPARPHSHVLWNQSSRMGSEVVYQCNSGYHNVGEGNVSICTAAGQWEEPPVLCQETVCGSPPVSESTEYMWNGGTAPGSTVLYFCKTGFLNKGGRNVSVCNESGQWTPPTLLCQEILCGDPPTLSHTGQVRNGSSTPGSTVTYYCKIGFYHSEGSNVSLCTINGSWTKPNISCKAKCGPVPFLANSEEVWHNRSVVVHRCVDGYHSWRGSNVSVCGSSGSWQTATLRCIEIKPAISRIHFLNERCMHWKAEKYEEDSEAYKVTYTGTRDYQRSFYDKRKQVLSSKAEQVTLCLHLLPATNYSISIMALSARFTVTTTTNTSLPVPPVPIVYYREFETPVPTLRLHRSANTLDPISLYQVFVLPVEDIMVFDCSSPGSPDLFSKNKLSSKYITAQILIGQIGKQINFTVGDGLYYGGFYNTPLQKGRTYYIILRAVSQWNTALKSSCVLWAKVQGTSYVLMVSSLTAAASVGLVAFAILGGYSCIWLIKTKTTTTLPADDL